MEQTWVVFTCILFLGAVSASTVKYNNEKLSFILCFTMDLKFRAIAYCVAKNSSAGFI